MGVFRVVADAAHLAAIVCLLVKIVVAQSCAGISGKSQFLYFLVFATRYMDVFTIFFAWYNSVMKVAFVLASAVTTFLIFAPFRMSWQKDKDTFRIWTLLLGCGTLAVLVNNEMSLLEVMWTFSMYLEVVALVPQIAMLEKTEKPKAINTVYLFLLALYNALYVANWIYKYYNSDGHSYNLISICCINVRTIIFVDFFYAFATSKGKLDTQPLLG